MKLAVILGVSQMVLGILIKGSNTIYFGSALDFIFEFVPQILFMLSTFGYMVFCIFLKWATDWNSKPDGMMSAPSIISTFIEMFFNGGKVTKPLWGDGSQQSTIEIVLLLISLIAVPMMLIPKPLILYIQNAIRSRSKRSRESLPLLEGHDHHGEEFDFGEVVVHTLIETIEFVLGSISHTASYLRLWALSLAHAELSKVFFQRTLASNVEDSNFVGIFIGFFIFANINLVVLMCMDSMECFLHTLRLHWVEFQTKFFKGDGVRFTPFSFEESISQYIERSSS
eukprot:TRINITY_DN2282_c0_g1_i3.p1 TRINITY_DN2282_c0_g1~~TRINITY_DN2282_c0_g1_i3.p1  ORF type:complete len:283 (-),score=66.02 TRINITY_DN2282_c0_g1_i3:130-978(-)